MTAAVDKPKRARKPKAPPVVAPAAPVEEIVAIKGFDMHWRCRGMQFAIGGTYTHDGPVVACKSGFHAIEGHPLEVFSYYPPGASRYAEVRQSGNLARHSNDSKVASARLTVVAEIALPDLIQRAVRWVFDQSKPEGETATGDLGAASATGDRGAASATGDLGAASVTGYRGAASATGYRGAASATGYRGAAMASGYAGRTMGANGNALFLTRRNVDWTITHVWAGIVGCDGIKPHVWYALDSDGKPVEVAQ